MTYYRIVGHGCSNAVREATAFCLLNQTLKENSQLRKEIFQINENFANFKNKIVDDLNVSLTKYEVSLSEANRLFHADVKVLTNDILGRLAALRDDVDLLQSNKEKM